ncbi:MAG: hypothetical protein O2816_13250 [Planctomycetota bacterium]|nr:hypothetical protein [Planctomycetota bacterium]
MLSALNLTMALSIAAPAQDAAPPIEAAAWVSHFGQTPSSESLRGRLVLVEAWATW